jgi:hypothetical protein
MAFADTFDKEIQDYLDSKKEWDDELSMNVTTLNVGSVFYAGQVAVALKDKEYINQDYTKWLIKFLIDQIMGHVMSGPMKDHDKNPPKSKNKSTDAALDFKRGLTQVYKQKASHKEIISLEHLPAVTRIYCIKLVSSFIYSYVPEYGMQIIKEEGWESLLKESIKYVTESVKNKIRRISDLLK